MLRLMSSITLAALLAASPVIAGGSMENPSDKKAPEANKTDSDNPAPASQGAAQAHGEKTPASKDAGATDGSSSGSSGSSDPAQADK